MLYRWLWTAEMEDVRILLGDVSPLFGILEVCHRILLVALFGLVAANLTVPFSHCGAFQIVGALQNSVFPNFFLMPSMVACSDFSRSSLLVSVNRSTCKMP